MTVRAGDHQGRASDQRPEELPHRHVEAVRGLLQNAVVRANREGVLHPVQAVHQGAVFVHHAFGLAGGTGGVEHVGQVVGLDADRLSNFSVWQRIQRPGLMSGWQARQPLRLGQGDLGIGVFDQERQARGR